MSDPPITDDQRGKGLIPSPFNPADFPLSGVMTDDQLLAVPPPAYAIVNPPPVLNQGMTPQCVAYASSSMKAWEDRGDTGKWWDFAEATFFAQIGGTAQGASLRNGFERMLHYGYPVTALGAATHHRIKAYYAVPLDHLTLKQAIIAFGPIIVGMFWPSSWSEPNAAGVVPAPAGRTNGHAILCIGWQDGKGFLFQNSWGSGWGIAGRCYIPADYLATDGGLPIRAFEAWKALDVIEVPATVTRRIVKAGGRIRAGMSGTATLISELPVDTSLVYKGTFTGGAYSWWNGSAWVTRNDWAKVVYGAYDRYVVRVNVR